MRVEDLINTSEAVDEKLGLMRSVDVQHRQLALDAIEVLIDRFIFPAMVDCQESTDRFHTFDIEEITQTEFRGLVRGIFEERLKELMNGLEKPGDDVLTETLEYVDIPIEDFNERERFFKCWAAEEADSSIHSLINFLKEPLIKPDAPRIESLPAEQTRVEKLLGQKLPDKLEYRLESLLNRIKREIG